ncbi:MAG: carotenoid 1,2-hydratase [Gammaproteobacteria bacterium]|nr:carotenoid 1,2-hydratase [Gammaproteobacteria bacterium]
MAIAIVGLFGMLLQWHTDVPPQPDGQGNYFRPHELLAANDNAGFVVADEPPALEFPRDHGPHPEYRTEWWYITGTLADTNGERFGYQLTFFRHAMTAMPAAGPSAWHARDAWMAHFAVTDVTATAFHHSERFSRGTLDLAGAGGEPLSIWLRDWRLWFDAGAWHLTARDGAIALTLDLTPTVAPVAQGDRGLSRKGRSAGNASIYYSMPRMQTRGSLSLPRGTFDLHGESWLDREWGTTLLDTDTVGWDWFALHLANGDNLMYYRLRRSDGAASAFSSGTMNRADGSTRRLFAGDVNTEPVLEWRSPETGMRYPAAWRLSIPSAGLMLDVTPVISGQEFTGAFRYWEGMVDVRGQTGNEAVTGAGYLEMTGYEE